MNSDSPIVFYGKSLIKHDNSLFKQVIINRERYDSSDEEQYKTKKSNHFESSDDELDDLKFEKYLNL